MRTFVQLLLGPTGFTAHSSEKSPPGGPAARVPDSQALLLIRGAIYTVLFKNCAGITLLLPGLRMLSVGAAMCCPGPST